METYKKSHAHRIINTLVSIMVCVGAVYLYKYTKHNSVFKVEATKLELISAPLLRVPNFDDDESDIGFFWFNAYNTDISNMDLSNLGNKIDFMSFDNLTKFPSADKLPAGFNPEKLLEDGKNPGLGIRDLHAKGITGKGVTVAIIDWPLYTDHQETKDNFIHYEELDWDKRKFDYEFHGIAMASIICGKTVGVAPGVNLAYFAPNITKGTEGETPAGNGNTYISNDIAALRKILEMNKKLPKDKKISAVSISRGWYQKSNLYPEFKKVVNELIDSGVMVLHVGTWAYDNLKGYVLLDREPNSDPDNVSSYSIGHPGGNLAIPNGGRTIAGNQATDNYRYDGKRQGGSSDSVAYTVGVYALAKQVYPDLMPKEFFDIVLKTGYNVNNQYVIIQPTKIIEYLQNKK